MSYSPQFEKEYEGGWEDFPSEDTLITAHSLNMYDGTFEHIEGYLEDHPIAQTTTMPTASASELGNVYQFVGETTATFTQGYFYKCVSDGAEEPTYSWQNINVQSGGGGGASALSDLTDVNIVSPTDGEGLIYNGSNQKWKNGNAPSALTNDYWSNSTTYAVGDIVIYLNGLYRCIVANTGQTPTATAYWEAISLSDINKRKVVNLWSGDQSATGDLPLTDSFLNFDEIELIWGANRTENTYLKNIRIDVADINTTIFAQFGDNWFSNSTTYCLWAGHFSDINKFTVDNIQSSGQYAPVHVYKIRGVKFG